MRWWLVLGVWAVGCGGSSPVETGDSGSGSSGVTGETGDTATGVCDPTETPVSFYCQSDLCNRCTDDCETRDEVLASIQVCTGTTLPTVTGCCGVDTCTDPTLGTFDRVTCPQAYGATYWWFDPATGALVGFAWSTDYNEWCDGASHGELFGPDLTSCQ